VISPLPVALGPLKVFSNTVSVSVALLFAGVGSAAPLLIVAVFVSVPLALGATVQLAVYVTLPSTGSVTLSLMLPLPLAVHVPPLAPPQVHAQVSGGGKVSLTVAALTAEGPALLATIV
jgi:hypothetical protein